MSYPMIARTLPKVPAALAALALAACAPTRPPEPASPDTQVEEEVGEEPVEETGSQAPPKGEYTCRISIAGEAQPEGACRLTEGDLPESLWFETVDGEVWISGAVTPESAERFELAGDVLCPQGACDEPLDATFRETDAGAYEARADTAEGEIVIEMSR